MAHFQTPLTHDFEDYILNDKQLGNTLKSLHWPDSPLRMSTSYLSTSSASSESTDVFLNCWTSRQLIFTGTPRKRCDLSLPAPQMGHSEARLFSFSELLCLSMMKHSLGGRRTLAILRKKTILRCLEELKLRRFTRPLFATSYKHKDCPGKEALWPVQLLVYLESSRLSFFFFLWVSSGLSVMPLSLSHP